MSRLSSIRSAPWPLRLAVLIALPGVITASWLWLPSVRSQPASQDQEQVFSCESAEACFRSAAAIQENRGTPEHREQVVAMKAERLRTVMDRYPGSLWGQRAGLLLGVMLIERQPAEALRYLKASQRDFPQLDDYLRLWIGEALAKHNDIVEAATMFESIRDAVPDSTVLPRAAYRTADMLYLADDCAGATEWYSRALAMNEKDVAAAAALLRLADCQARAGRVDKARDALKQVWIRFPHTSESREAMGRLDGTIEGGAWQPSAEDHYQRAQAWLGLAMSAEAIDELRRFLSADAHHPRRFDARLKIGIAQTRLKQYDAARETFRILAAERVPEAAEATVWLSRVYLRQGVGDKLLELARAAQQASLAGDQKALVQLFAGIWLEDQARYDEAITAFRSVAKVGESATQRAEGHWRVGWVQYHTGRYKEAADTFRMLAELQVPAYEPQALYWLARASEFEKRGLVRDVYGRLCERYAYSYYCQLAARRAGVRPEPDLPAMPIATATGGPTPLPDNRRPELERHPAYQRAVELKILGLSQDAARELAVLADQYSRDQEVLLAFSALLNEVGAYHPALRLVKVHFRDRLERGGLPASSALWTVAYPTGLIPLIEAQGTSLDPYLAAAIIREESQYDEKAISMVGAVGLMQLMPATANQVAQRFGLPSVEREDLFDPTINVQLGVRYLGQLLEQFAGNVVYAVAAYNAGPAVVSNWVTLYQGREPDEFVEFIPYQETRLYVKRVLRSYGEYLRLRQGSPPTPLS